MLFSYISVPRGLARLPEGRALSEARWIDLYRPTEAQVTELRGLGVEVPTLAEMEEIEISNRLYREDGVDYMTVVITGQTPEGQQVVGPVTFILGHGRLVTVRHHAPRPFETYPERADKSSAGCASAERIFLGLIEEIVSRAADLLEASGRGLDGVATAVLDPQIEGRDPKALQLSLVQVGRQGEMLGKIRLGLLTVERAVSFFGQSLEERRDGEGLKPLVKAEMRDIQALAVHADFLSARVALTVDATMGMINLDQNRTVRILSVVAALFLPPTLIASVYGMNFTLMPELQERWGYPYALVLMAASSAATWAFFKWKKWL